MRILLEPWPVLERMTTDILALALFRPFGLPWHRMYLILCVLSLQQGQCACQKYRSSEPLCLTAMTC